jgi:hypothetical protein
MKAALPLRTASGPGFCLPHGPSGSSASAWGPRNPHCMGSANGLVPLQILEGADAAVA